MEGSFKHMLSMSAGLPVVAVAVTLAGPPKGGDSPPPDPAIVYADGGIKVMNADGTNQRAVVSVGRKDWVRTPAWSPDDSEIVFCGSLGGVPGIYTVPTAGGASHFVTPITPPFSGPADPDWSPVPTPDGSYRIAFSDKGVTEGDEDIYLVRPDGTGRLNLTSSADYFEFSASWSPDGRFLAVERMPADPLLDIQLVILAVDSAGGSLAITGETVVWTNLWGVAWPRWSNTSGQVAFSLSLTGIATLDVSDPFATPVMLTSGSDKWPSFSPDDTQLAFYRAGRTGGIFVVNADGSGVTQINSRGSDPRWRHTP